MTNEQLAILLDGVQQELDTAIAQTRALLVVDRPRRREFVHRPPTICLNMNCDNPAHVTEIEYDDPVSELDPVDAVSTSIGGRIAMLRR